MQLLLIRAFFFIILSVGISSFLIQNQTVFAEVKQSQLLVCLKPERCDNADVSCQEKSSHRVRLTSEENSPTTPNAPVYILECISTPKGQICTTGNADSHPELEWNTSLTELEEAVEYEFQGLFTSVGTPIAQLENPLISDTQGKIPPVEWKSYTKDLTLHTFYALSFPEPVVVAGEDHPSQKQGTFELIPGSNDCTSLRWDPYGIVFDSQTLEPIPGADVRLLEQSASDFILANIPGIPSTITTKADGVFNFVVPDGVYKLDASHPSYLPLLPVNLSDLNANYSRIYSDIYPVVNSTNEINQVAGIAQHRDIALNPQPATSGVYPVTVMDYAQELEKLFGTLVIKGKVSHPFAQIKVYTFQGDSTEKVRYLPLQLAANKFGVFNIRINLATLNSGERIGGLEFEKVDINNLISKNRLIERLTSFMQAIFRPVSAQQITPEQTATTADLSLESIANYLEGFAYDSSGAVIANAVVGVYLPFADQPYSESTADENGYFTISSEFLPSVPYTLRYTDSQGEVTEATVSEFLTQNARYIEASSVNPHLYSDAQGTIIQITPTVAQTETVENQPIVPEEKDQRAAFILVVLVILLFGVIGVVVGYHYINKKNTKLQS